MTTVTVVLVARNGAKHLPATLAALAAQTRRPDRVLAVDAGSSDGSLRLLQDGLPGAMVVSGRRGGLAEVAAAVLRSAPAEDPGEWYWFLGHDNAPHPRALEALLGAVEVAPSVLVVGPKLTRWDERQIIDGFGETVTGTGASVQLVSGELDQSQHDGRTDVLGVAVPGMLVQAALWQRLGGFDPGLPSVDAGLDLGIRARLAGARVERVPGARIAAAGPVELFGRKSLAAGARNRVRRAAQLHRRLAYAPVAALPLLWLLIVPWAAVRAVWQVLAKRPGFAPGELAAGFLAAFDPTVLPARRRIRAARAVPWSTLQPFRLNGRDARELQDRAVAVETRTADESVDGPERASFWGAGGGWVVLAAAVAGLGLWWRLLGTTGIAGGALAPLGRLADLWGALGVRGRFEDGGVGSADPFHAVLALLGSATWWSPGFAIVVLTIAAIPLSAVSGWFLAARLSPRGWAPALVAVGWAVAPPLLAALDGGEPGAVVAHILLPWLALAVLDARRSWSMTAVAGLLLAAVAAGSPSLVPALVVLLVLLVVATPRGAGRRLLTLLPAAALFAPLVVEQLRRGAPLALLADPGAAVAQAMPRPLALLLGSPTADYAGWHGFLDVLGLPDALPGAVVLAIVAAPLALLALLAAFLRRGARAVPALVAAAAGLLTAVGESILHVTSAPDGADGAIWAGSGLSLYWLGLLCAAAVALDGLGRFAPVPALVAMLGLVLAAAPLAAATATGRTAVQATNGRVLPALVVAEGEADPGLGTLDVTASGQNDYSVVLQRGTGLTAERITTLDTTDRTPGDPAIAQLVGDLVADSGADTATAMADAGIAFVLLRDAGADSAAATSAANALAAKPDLQYLGVTPQGRLWQTAADAEHGAAAEAAGPGPWDTPLGWASALLQIVVFGVFGLLAIPTTRRRGVRTAHGPALDLADEEDEA